MRHGSKHVKHGGIGSPDQLLILTTTPKGLSSSSSLRARLHTCLVAEPNTRQQPPLAPNIASLRRTNYVDLAAARWPCVGLRLVRGPPHSPYHATPPDG